MDVDDRLGSVRRNRDHVDAVQYGPDLPDVFFMDGVFRRVSEAETARRAGTAAEKTNEVPLTCW